MRNKQPPHPQGASVVWVSARLERRAKQPGPWQRDCPPLIAKNALPLLRKLRCFERGALARRHAIDREFLDCLIEKAMKIELCGEVQEHSAKADRGAVHEDEFAGNPHRPFFLERAMNP